MASPNLPTGIDATYADDPADESVAAHQQHHDTLHTWLNTVDVDAAPATGDRLTWDGSLWTADTPISAGQVATVLVASNDAPAAVQDSADYVCDGTADEVQINLALIDAAPLFSRNSAMPAGAQQRGIVQLSGGRFVISNPIRMLDGTHLQGTGYLTELYLSGLSSTGAGYGGTDAEAAIQPYETSGASTCHLVRVSHLFIKGSADSVGHGIHFWGGGSRSGYPDSSPDPQVDIHDVYFDLNGGTRHGLWLSNDMRGTMIHNCNGSATGNSIYFTGTPDSFISNCHVHSAGTGYAGFWFDGGNIRATNSKAYYCDTGFYLPGGRTQLSSCESQDNRIGFNFIGPNHVAAAITADGCQDDGLVIASAFTTISAFHCLWRTGGRYPSATNAIRFTSGYTDVQLTGTVKKNSSYPTTTISGTYNGARNFIRVSDGTTLYSVG